MLWIILFTGAASGLKTATILRELTTFPKPMLINFAKAVFCLRYSIFWICSRIFSISVLRSIAILETSRSFDLERIVFASRFISYAMKSILRPIPSDSWRIFCMPWIWLCSLTVSSSLQILSENKITSAAIRLSSIWESSRSSCTFCSSFSRYRNRS